jgi:hypothetical protein
MVRRGSTARVRQRASQKRRYSRRICPGCRIHRVRRQALVQPGRFSGQAYRPVCAAFTVAARDATKAVLWMYRGQLAGLGQGGRRPGAGLGVRPGSKAPHERRSRYGDREARPRRRLSAEWLVVLGGPSGRRSAATRAEPMGVVRRMCADVSTHTSRRSGTSERQREVSRCRKQQRGVRIAGAFCTKA